MSDIAVESYDNVDSSIGGVVMQLVLSAVMTAVFVTVFIVLRNTPLGKPVYSPRIINIPEESPPFYQKPLDWLKSLFKYNDSFILDNISLDAVMLMNFYRMGIYVCLFGSLIICPVLTSLDYYSHHENLITRVVNGTSNNTETNSLNGRSLEYTSLHDLSQLATIEEDEYNLYFTLSKRANETVDENGNLIDGENISDNLNNTNITEVVSTALNMSIQVFSIANVPDNSPVFIAHTVCCYLYSLLVMFFLWNNYKKYAEYYKETVKKGGLIRTRSIKTEVLQSKTVMIRNLPSNLQDKYSLIDWFNNLKVGKVEDIHIIYDYNSKLASAVIKRTNTLYSLEKAYLSYKNNIDKNAQEKNFIRRFLEKKVLKKFPNALNNLFNPGDHKNENDNDPEIQRKKELRKLRPSHFTGTLFPLNGKFVDSISTYEANLKKYTEKIIQLREEAIQKEACPDEKKRAYTAFVTFKDTRAAKIVSQLNLYTSDNKNTMLCMPAPNPTNLQWENLQSRVEKKQSMSLAISVALFFMCIFYMVPVHMITSMTELKKLKEIEFLHDFLEKITKHALVETFFENILPSLLINVLLSLVPTIIFILTKFEYFESNSQREKSFLKKYYLFILFNILFICSLSKAFWGIFLDVINDPKSIISLLGKQLPKGANFFIVFIVYRIQAPASELASVASIAIGWLKRKFLFKTKRQIYDYEHATMPLNYGLVYPMPLLIFTIVTVYSCISSFVLIPGIFYFFFAYLNQKNNILYINVKHWENNGVYYNLIFNRIIFALIISQLTLIGMFWTKDNGYVSTSLIPIVVITFIFYKLCKNSYGDIHENTPIDQFVDGQTFTNCKSTLLASTYEDLKDERSKGVHRRTSSQVSLSKEDLKNCMQDAIDNNLRDKTMIEYLKDQLDTLVKSDKFKDSNDYLQVPQKTAKMTEFKPLNDSEKSKTPENNYGASEVIYITAQKKRKTPQFSCLAESELPQIPNYYLEAQYNLPDMTSYLYTPWMPEGLDESLIERLDEQPSEDKDSSDDVSGNKDNDGNNGNDVKIKIEIVDEDNKKENENSKETQQNNNTENNEDNKIIDIEKDDDDDDKPLVDNITSEPEEKKEEIKPDKMVIDVNNLEDDGSDDNIYLSLPNTATVESPIKEGVEKNEKDPNKRTTVYLDL